MVDMYAKAGDLNDARRLFERIQYRDSISWNVIIVGYAHEEDENEALSVFRRMTFDRILPDEVSLSSILSACANLRALEQGKQVHCYSVKSGFDMNIYARSSLVDMYAKCGVMETATKVLSRMPEQSVVSRNALIAGYVMNKNTEEAINQFQEILKEGLRPSKFTFAGILVACSGSLRLNMAKLVHCITLKSDVFHDDEFFGVSLLGVYLNSDTKDDTMRRDDALPDQATFVSVLSACAGLAALKEGIQIHSLIFRTRFNLDEFTCSALIYMYTKCGEVGSSVQVFEEIFQVQM